jgi:hypothetical protein
MHVPIRHRPAWKGSAFGISSSRRMPPVLPVPAGVASRAAAEQSGPGYRPGTVGDGYRCARGRGYIVIPANAGLLAVTVGKPSAEPRFVRGAAR